MFFLKTFWEKEKMLVTSIFSFSHNVFLINRKTTIIGATVSLTSANSFNLLLKGFHLNQS